MEASTISRTIEKVDQAVARLKELQISIATTRMNVETNGNSERQKSCSQSMSPRNDCHDLLGGYKRPVQCAESFHMEERQVSAMSKGKWRQWSAPAEIVHQAMSEILLASRFSEEMAALVVDSLEQRNKEKLKEEGNSILRKFEAVVPLQESVGKIQMPNDIIYSAKDECAKTSSQIRNALGNDIALASPLVDANHYSIPNDLSNVSVEATRIKSAHTSLPSKSLICPNHSFASKSSFPSSPTFLKTSTALKGVDALPSAHKNKLVGPKQSISRTSSQRRPSFSGKLQRSPLKSVSNQEKVMMMSTQRKAKTTCQRLTSSSSTGSGLAKQPQKCEEFPIHYFNPEAKKPLKVPSHQSHLDASDCTRRSHAYGRSDRQPVNSQQTNFVRPSKIKTADGQVLKKQQIRDFHTKLKQFELVQDKENLQLAGCTPAALCLKGKWFAGNERVPTLTKRKQ